MTEHMTEQMTTKHADLQPGETMQSYAIPLISQSRLQELLSRIHKELHEDTVVAAKTLLADNPDVEVEPVLIQTSCRLAFSEHVTVKEKADGI